MEGLCSVPLQIERRLERAGDFGMEVGIDRVFVVGDTEIVEIPLERNDFLCLPEEIK